MTKIQAQNEDADMIQPSPDDGVAPETAAGGDAAARIADLEKQLAEMKDRALREMAEAENTRRRAQKDKEDISKYAVASLARELLPIADNFNRAIEAAPKDVADPGVKNLIAGVEATGRQLDAALERVGIKRMNPLGQKFDPNLHQVMSEIDSDQPAGTVVQVMQAGYTIHDRLLREALVAVSKGGATTKVDTSA